MVPFGGVERKPNRRNKALFLNSPGVLPASTQGQTSVYLSTQTNFAVDCQQSNMV